MVGKKSSRYLFNFTVEPFWQEAIILFYFFLHDISAPPSPAGVYFCVDSVRRRRFNIPSPRALLRQFSRQRITI